MMAMWKRSLQALGLLVLFGTELADADMPPWNGGKFVIYADPGDQHALDVEIIGTVVGRNILQIPPINAAEPFVAVWYNYATLLFPENLIRPQPGDRGWSYWNDFLNPTVTVINFEELSQVGYRLPETAADVTPSVYDETTVPPAMRQIQVGDVIRIKGLYVVDYDHSMYSLTHDSACYSDFFPPLLHCLVHAELHPYRYYGIQLVRPPRTGIGIAYANTETITVVAPRMPVVYSRTNFWNQLAGVAGHYDSSYTATSVQPFSFYIPAPPMPACRGTCVLRYQSTVNTTGRGSYESHPILIYSAPAGVHVRNTAVNGSDPMHPMVYQETFSVYWTDSADDPSPCGPCPFPSAQHVFFGQCVGTPPTTCQLNCDAGWNDCDGDPTNGCESNAATDWQNCGGCGIACQAPFAACIGGQCTSCDTCGFQICCPPRGCYIDPNFGTPRCGDTGPSIAQNLTPAAYDHDFTDGRVNQSAKQQGIFYGLTRTDPTGFGERDSIFTDRFDRTTGLGTNWSIFAGSYTTDGTYATSGTPSVNGNLVSIVPALATDNYGVSSRIVIPPGATRSGLVARSAGTEFDRDFYTAMLSTDGAVHLFRRNTWAYTELTPPFPAAIAPNKEYALNLVTTGADPVHIEVWLDGALTIRYDDSSANQLRSGRIGLVNYEGNVKYGKFVVYGH